MHVVSVNLVHQFPDVELSMVLKNTPLQAEEGAMTHRTKQEGGIIIMMIIVIIIISIIIIIVVIIVVVVVAVVVVV